MTMRVTMRTPRRSEDGLSYLLATVTYTVSDAYGRELVQGDHAFDTDNAIAAESAARRDQLLTEEARTTRALVSGGGIGPATLSYPDGLEIDDDVTATPTAGWIWSGGQWYRDDAAISGETSSTHSIVALDQSKLLGFQPTGLPFRVTVAVPGPLVQPGQLFFASQQVFFAGQPVLFN